MHRHTTNKHTSVTDAMLESEHMIIENDGIFGHCLNDSRVVITYQSLLNHCVCHGHTRLHDNSNIRFYWGVIIIHLIWGISYYMLRQGISHFTCIMKTMWYGYADHEGCLGSGSSHILDETYQSYWICREYNVWTSNSCVWFSLAKLIWQAGSHLNIKMSSYQYRDSHYENKIGRMTVLSL